MTEREPTHMLIARAIQAGAGSMEALAADVGVTYASLKAWADGRRNPTPDNLRRLADALERRGGELRDLARELREAAE